MNTSDLEHPCHELQSQSAIVRITNYLPSLNFPNDIYKIYPLAPLLPVFLLSILILLKSTSSIKAMANYHPPRSGPLRFIIRRLPLAQGPSTAGDVDVGKPCATTEAVYPLTGKETMQKGEGSRYRRRHHIRTFPRSPAHHRARWSRSQVTKMEKRRKRERGKGKENGGNVNGGTGNKMK